MTDISGRVAQAVTLSRITSNDRQLSPAVRKRAFGCALLCANHQYALALQRLDALHKDTVPHLQTQEPQVDYARCIGVLTFWRFNIDIAIKTAFPDHDNYRRRIERSQHPEMLLTSDLGPGPLVQANHSWLAPARLIAGLTAAQTQIRLNFNQPPPYVIMVFSKSKMQAAGVEVREPRGIDAIPRRLTQWRPDNVPGERIDRDIPLAALERLEWRP